MSGALLYLTLCSVRNRARVRLRRLRQPRYLIGTVVGVAYFYYFFFRRSSRSQGPRGLAEVIARLGEIVTVLGALGLLLLAGLAWFWPGDRKAALNFSQSDVHFLFTAPLARRQLVRYKVLRSQLGVFFGSAIMTVFFRPASLASGATFFLGLAIVMAVVNLHLTGVALHRHAGRTADGRVAWATRGPQMFVIATALAAVIALVTSWASLTAVTTSVEAAQAARRLSHDGILGVLLWPFLSLASLPLAGSWAEFVRLLPGPVAVLAINYLWVVRAETPFEEASALRAEKVASVQAGQRPVRSSTRAVRKAPFALALSGRPEPAIVWKNTLMLGRGLSVGLLVRLLLVFGIMAFAFGRAGRTDVSGVLAVLCLVLVVFTVILGPQIVRNDLRRDLRQLEILKTWPMRSAALVRGEVLAPAIVLTSVVVVLILVATLLAGSLPAEAAWLSDGRFTYAAAALAVAPGLIAAQLTMQNAMAVMFPAWVVTGDTRARGVDVMGQRMLMLAAMMLVLVLAALPAAVAAGLVGAAIYAATGLVPIVVPAVVAGLAMVVESAMATEALGALLARTDIGAVDPMN